MQGANCVLWRLDNATAGRINGCLDRLAHGGHVLLERLRMAWR